MLKKRIIPVLLYKSGILVRSNQFDYYQSTGDPYTQIQRYVKWKADELIYIDISQDYLINLNDTMQVIGSITGINIRNNEKHADFIGVIKNIAKQCFIPLTIGGNIRTIEDVRLRIKNGADKVAINSEIILRPSFITEIVNEFGSQALVASIDSKFKNGRWTVYSNKGSFDTNMDPVIWAKEVERLGVGEILLNSIDRDGMGMGYDLQYIYNVSHAVKIPVIALGGVGDYSHLKQGLDAGASALAAANLFHFREQSIIEAKKYLLNEGISVRI